MRELTPETSFGFDVIEFARDVLGQPFDPWQEWLVVHAGELLPDGRPRFRIVLVLAARQNGKTHVPVVLSSFWQFVEAVPLILGTSTKLDYARESWQKATKLARTIPALEARLPRTRSRGIRSVNGEQEMVTTEDSRYKIAASNEEGGRSLTVHRAILDELRQHHDYSAWDAIIPAGNAVWDFQAWAMTNAGSARSVVLNDLRSSALTFIESGVGDERLGLFEWSAPEGSSPLDVAALAQANPNMGHRVDADALLGDARRAVDKGGDALIGFLTEQMCLSVPRDKAPAIPAASWAACRDPKSQRAGAPALAVDVSPDRSWASVAFAAVRDDGLPMVQVVRHGEGTAWLVDHVSELAAAKGAVCVVMDGQGPVKNLRADLEDALIGVSELLVMKAGDLTDACASMFDAVVTEQLRQTGQLELDDAVANAEERPLGDRWAFGRRKSAVDISPLVACTAALWGLSVCDPANYDVEESVH